MGTTLRDDRWLPVLLAAIGFLFSAYLEFLHVRAWLDPSASSFCTVAKAADCTAVALSSWSSIGSIPLPIWGAAGFWVLLVASVRRSPWLLPLAIFAAIASLGLLTIELVAIGSICLFCEVVHVASWGLAIVAWVGRAKLTAPQRDKTLLAYGIAPAGWVLLMVLTAMPSYFRVPTWRGEPPFPTGLNADAKHWIGSAAPSLVVEEWVDYACPHCKAATQRTLRALAKRGSKVRVERRNFPRVACSETSPSSCMSLRVALCAAKQDRFWQMDRWLFTHIDKGQVNLEAAARDVGLNVETLKQCYVAPSTFEAAETENRAARKAHVVETPTYRIDGKKVNEEDVIARIKAAK